MALEQPGHGDRRRRAACVVAPLGVHRDDGEARRTGGALGDRGTQAQHGGTLQPRMPRPYPDYCGRDGGYLCLGEAECPSPAIATTLLPLASDTRIFATST